jgi:signal transduction histidine kinase
LSVIAVAASAVGIFALAHDSSASVDSWDVLETLVGWTFVGSGLYAWHRRPASRLGPLMIVAGLMWLVGRALRQIAVPIAFTGGAWIGDLWTAAFVWVLLAFPDGRLNSAFDRIVPALIVAVVGPLDLVWLLFWKPSEGTGNALLTWDNADVADAIDTSQRLIVAGATLVLAVVLASRWLAASKPLRRALLPVLAGAASLLLGTTLNALDRVGVSAPTVRWLLLLALAAVPIAMMAGVLRSRMARAGVGTLVLDLHADPSPDDLRASMARALGDPTLEVAYWLPKLAYYADSEGRPVDVAAGVNGRTATTIERKGVPIAALLHDSSLDDEPELLNSVAAAAGMALENGQLHAELHARLEDLQGLQSRANEAEATERKRLERNLHDGTQQRLIALSMELTLLERRIGADPDLAARLEHARNELMMSLTELRDVARGLHPTLLTVQGLPAALESITAVCAVPARLSVDVAARLPEPVEVAAYYVVSESLANVGKHADASAVWVDVFCEAGSVVVEVTDDGIGGADPDKGSGLRGLRDRVEALGGTLLVSVPRMGGTRIRAEVPSA